MNTGEGLTRGTAWLALTLYVASEVARHPGFRSASRRLAVCWLSSLGCAALLGHILCAFHFHHHWSHGAAYADTARQTAALTGWSWGGGLYVNFVFAAVWVGEVVRLWITRAPVEVRAGWGIWLVRVFFLFMFVNGAVIFVTGPARWFGLLGCLMLAVLWSRPNRRIA
jgi:hypothetical protein